MSVLWRKLVDVQRKVPEDSNTLTKLARGPSPSPPPREVVVLIEQSLLLRVGSTGGRTPQPVRTTLGPGHYPRAPETAPLVDSPRGRETTETLPRSTTRIKCPTGVTEVRRGLWFTVEP